MRSWTAGILLVVALALAGSAGADPFDEGLAAYLSNNYPAAFRLWTPLAEQGNARAQNNLGIMHENGQGLPRDHKEAVKWYRRAAEQGDADAQLNLGLMYENGRGVAQDNVRAHMWFSLSATAATGGMLWAGLEVVVARDRVAAKMTPAEIAQAQAMERKCLESLYWQCD